MAEVQQHGISPVPTLPEPPGLPASIVLADFHSFCPKIDEILAWERRFEAEGDTRFVELGRYLCEVRGGAVLAAGETEVR